MHVINRAHARWFASFLAAKVPSRTSTVAESASAKGYGTAFSRTGNHWDQLLSASFRFDIFPPARSVLGSRPLAQDSIEAISFF